MEDAWRSGYFGNARVKRGRSERRDTSEVLTPASLRHALQGSSVRLTRFSVSADVEAQRLGVGARAGEGVDREGEQKAGICGGSGQCGVNESST
eukprot:4189102-Pleurochrysis_carterae.AAC.1